MKSPTALVTAALMAATLVAASLLIAAGTRGDNALASRFRNSYNSAQPGLQDLACGQAEAAMPCVRTGEPASGEPLPFDAK
jgi:hypothetical protein